MSINDLIASNCNNFFEQGKKTERQRVLRICEEISIPYESEWANENGEVVFIKDLMSYMNDKDYE
mgnify:FL=1|tara:strand:+ start:536 stop:730 length:195 start_codon:yes stop_codon:yes gene_type:complete